MKKHRTLLATPDWAKRSADQVVARFPDQPCYVGAAGISPSGPIHFGNFRDVSTTLAVLQALKEAGHRTRLVYSWDDFDRFRKVPAGIPGEFQSFLGRPLSQVPDPEGTLGSYAERFEQQFERDMASLDLSIDYIRQSERYAAGAYDHLIRRSIEQREHIAEILFSLMSEKAIKAAGLSRADYIASYYPVAVYSRFSGTDATTVTGVDGDRINYHCRQTNQDDSVAIGRDRLIKLAWKIDWPMRWHYEGVHFEPAGADHASPGSSFDAGDRIITKIFNGTPPVHLTYGFVGVSGHAGKMSGSRGTGVTIGQLLQIYEPAVLQWLYWRKQPKQYFSLAFDSEIYRQYDEFDRVQRTGQPLPFRQAVGFGQVVSWDSVKLASILDGLKMPADSESIAARLPLAKNWLEAYNPDQAVALRTQVNRSYAKRLRAEPRRLVTALREQLADRDLTIPQLEELVYSIAKDPQVDEATNRQAQRAFFIDVYQLLVGRDTGPRLSTFLWAADRAKVIELLTV